MSKHFLGARAPRGQSGFTLVELMVALLIGLFLLGGLMTLLQDNRRSFASQNQLSQLQDSQRLAMTMITDVIQAAGYFPLPQQYTSAVSLPTAGTMAAGQALQGTGAYAAAAPGDTITVRYATTTGDGVLNCIGGTNTSGNGAPLLYTNVFSVVNGQLVCTLSIGNGAATVYPLVGGVPGTPNAIVVNSLSILYGINSGGGTANVDEYVDATAVPNWNSIISVQITLTFNNPLWSAVNQGQGNQPQYLIFQRIVPVMNQTGI
jgi:type IV pilus assembly protein PilW